MYYNQIEVLESKLDDLDQPGKPEVLLQLLSYYQTKDISKARFYANLIEKTLSDPNAKLSNQATCDLMDKLVSWYESCHDIENAFSTLKKLYKLRTTDKKSNLSKKSIKIDGDSRPKLDTQLRIILDAIPIQVCYLDSDLVYQYANKAYLKSVGISNKTIIGRKAQKVIGKQAMGSIYYYVQQVLQGKKISYRQEMDYKHGKKWVETTLYPVNDPINQKTVGIIALTEDITEIQNLSRSLINSNEALTEFAYATSHDLKEPIRSIVSFTQLLERKLGGQLQGEQVQFMDQVVNSAHRLHRIIDDLERYAAIENNKSYEQEIDLSIILRGVVQSLEEPIIEKQAIFQFDTMPNIMADPKAMYLLFSNLLDNTLKYADPNRKPLIQIQYVDQLNSHFISIKDNGIGFNSDYKNKIFGLFKRLHKHDSIPGTGIGLAICQKIVRKMNGYLWAESIEGKGSTFYINIPKSRDKILLQ